MTKTSSPFGYLIKSNAHADFDLWFTYRRDSAATTMPMAVYLRDVPFIGASPRRFQGMEPSAALWTRRS